METTDTTSKTNSMSEFLDELDRILADLENMTGEMFPPVDTDRITPRQQAAIDDLTRTAEHAGTITKKEITQWDSRSVRLVIENDTRFTFRLRSWRIGPRGGVEVLFDSWEKTK